MTIHFNQVDFEYWNAKIAILMGYIDNGCSSDGFLINPITNFDVDISFFDYHKNWRELMFVIEKIESIEEIDVDILTNGTKIYEWKAGGEVIVNNCAEVSFEHKIEHTYLAVIDFLDWYNKKNNIID